MRSISVILISVLLLSCDTRRDILEDMTVWVKVKIDWEKSGLSPNGASVYFFPHDCSRSKPEVLLTNETLDSIRLWKGTYSVLVFNETVDGHDYIRFRGTDKYETFEAYSKPSTTAGKYLTTVSEDVVASPNMLAVTAIDKFTIERDMIESQTSVLLECSPTPIVHQTTVKIHIKGLNNLSRSGSYGVLNCFSGGKFLCDNKLSEKANKYLFVLNNKKYDEGSSTEGDLSATFYCFGAMGGSQNSGDNESAYSDHIISLFLRLRDKSFYEIIDKKVTSQMSTGNNDCLELIFDLGLGNGNEIVLPEVPDDDVPDSGFDIDVNDWGEIIVTNISI